MDLHVIITDREEDFVDYELYLSDDGEYVFCDCINHEIIPCINTIQLSVAISAVAKYLAKQELHVEQILNI